MKNKKYKDFSEFLYYYQKEHPGDYYSYPCPKCGAPISMMYGSGVAYGKCTTPKCDYEFDDIYAIEDF